MGDWKIASNILLNNCMAVMGSLDHPIAKVEIHGVLTADGESFNKSRGKQAIPDLGDPGGGSGGSLLLFLQTLMMGNKSLLSSGGGAGGGSVGMEVLFGVRSVWTCRGWSAGMGVEVMGCRWQRCGAGAGGADAGMGMPVL